VKDGMMTLNGFANNHSEKREAVQAAKRVLGMKAIAFIPLDIPLR
jgi:osmotically-inducible protein OsmY